MDPEAGWVVQLVGYDRRVEPTEGPNRRSVLVKELEELLEEPLQHLYFHGRRLNVSSSTKEDAPLDIADT